MIDLLIQIMGLRKEKIKLEKEVADLREARSSLKEAYHVEMLQLEVECAKQKGNYEHEWHSGMEKRKVELAQVDAQIIERKKFLNEMGGEYKVVKELLTEVLTSLKPKT